jgi:hypothetical protein
MFDPLVLSDTKDMYANTETRCGGMAKTFTNTQTERQGPSAGDVWPWLEHTVTQSLLPLSPSSACAPHKTTSPSSFPNPGRHPAAEVQGSYESSGLRLARRGVSAAPSSVPHRRYISLFTLCVPSCISIFSAICFVLPGQLDNI